jgi:radical SAM superfamily enzyme YgiQ (UPF0313 family)
MTSADRQGTEASHARTADEKTARVLLIQAAASRTNRAIWRSGEATIYQIADVDIENRTLQHFHFAAPLPAVTLAALTPSGFEVQVWDEHVDGPVDLAPTLPAFDIVGVSLMFSYLADRGRELAAFFRKRGATVALGGPAVSAAPHRFRGVADVVFLNEAERTWPRFVVDWSRGEHKPEYVQVDKPPLDESPMPRWDLVDDRLSKYFYGTVQTTRGCPFDCEFCDVIYLFGRAQRHKPVDRVVAEVSELQRRGARRVFFTDDEFIGDPRYAKTLLRALIPVNNAFPEPLRYHTQLTMNLSKDVELLELVTDANFYSLLIGIESFDAEALRETHKMQNIRKDLVEDVRTILSYGLGATGSFIVGFDHDGPDVFERLLDGIRRSCLPAIGLSMLEVFPGTKLWARLRQEDRVVALRTAANVPSALRLKLQPAGMSRVELLEGFRFLNHKVHEWSEIADRLRGWVSLVTRPPRVSERTLDRDDAVWLLREMRDKLGIGPADLAHIEGALEHTWQVAPFMCNRVVAAIFRNAYNKKMRATFSDDQFREAVAAEKKGDLVRDTTTVVIPPAFNAAFEELFSLVYARLHNNLRDRNVLPEASTDVLADFALRWGESFEAPNAVHRQYLNELCDRTAARINGIAPELFVAAPEPSPPVSLANVKKTRLADSVLKAVNDSLRKVEGGAPASGTPELTSL